MDTEHSVFSADRVPSADDALHAYESARPPSPPRQIPWGYGRDRVTAIAVDPDRLFVYWEVRDESIDQARGQLGPAGARAALVLRIYDTSGRIFDGANAHSFFDQDVHRNDRQWFCEIGKPSSSAHVEMGLRTHDGRFLKVTRSGRVDFPRSEPAPGRHSEWMRVVASTGDILSRETASGSAGHFGGAPGAGEQGEAERFAAGDSASVELLSSFEHHQLEPYEVRQYDFARFETDTGWQSDWSDPTTVYRTITTSWQEMGLGTWSWETGPSESSWQAGPFSYPTEVIVPVAERFEGPTLVYRSGEQVRVLHGPWQVIIRGIQPHSSRRVLARWEVHRSWVSVASRPGEAPVTGLPGVRNGVPLGASHALSASELRLRGASEVFFLGASERRLGGASETRFLAASQWIARGASERRLTGASEWRLGGASEWRMLGASERRLAGASERHMAGASERRLGGASERRLGGASEAKMSWPQNLAASKEG
jgi:hypothetical protein